MSSLPERRLSVVLLSSIPIILWEINGFYNPPLSRSSPLAFWLVDGASFVVVPGLIVYLLAKSFGISPKHYGLQFPPQLSGELVAISLFLGALLFVLYFLPQRIVWALLGYPAPMFSWGSVVPTGAFRLPVVMYMSLSAGLAESAFFIGLPWFLWRRFLKLAHRRTLFALASSFLFASVHWEQGLPGLVAAFVFGFAACFLYWKLNDLWPVVGAHAVVDLVEFY